MALRVRAGISIAKKTKLLSEIYFFSREVPSAANRLAANIGFKHKLRDNLSIHAAVAKGGAKAIAAGRTCACISA